jgi:hypothetical protein
VWAKARSAVPTMERQQGAKSMSNRWFAVAALLLLFAAPARAGCLYKTFDFHPEKNDGVVVDAIVDAGSSCTHNFAEGPGYKFTGITLEQPEHGKVVKAGVNRFVYRPDKGFTGKDAYMFKICATKGKQKGCSAVAFVPEVR